jgi:hypothetical protein
MAPDIPKIDPDRHPNLGDAAWNFRDEVFRWLFHGDSLSDPRDRLIPFCGKFKPRSTKFLKPRISGTLPSHFTLYGLANWHSGFGSTSRVRADCSKRPTVEVLQSAENRRANLVCGAVPEGVGSEMICPRLRIQMITSWLLRRCKASL